MPNGSKVEKNGSNVLETSLHLDIPRGQEGAAASLIRNGPALSSGQEGAPGPAGNGTLLPHPNGGEGVPPVGGGRGSGAAGSMLTARTGGRDETDRSPGGMESVMTPRTGERAMDGAQLVARQALNPEP